MVTKQLILTMTNDRKVGPSRVAQRGLTQQNPTIEIYGLVLHMIKVSSTMSSEKVKRIFYLRAPICNIINKV